MQSCAPQTEFNQRDATESPRIKRSHRQRGCGGRMASESSDDQVCRIAASAEVLSACAWPAHQSKLGHDDDVSLIVVRDDGRVDLNVLKDRGCARHWGRGFSKSCRGRLLRAPTSRRIPRISNISAAKAKRTENNRTASRYKARNVNSMTIAPSSN